MVEEENVLSHNTGNVVVSVKIVTMDEVFEIVESKLKVFVSTIKALVRRELEAGVHEALM